jgi:Fe-S-cluster-containing hydrogenase component 2
MATHQRREGLVVHADRCSGCRICLMVCSLGHEGAVAPSLARLSVQHDPFEDDHPSVDVCLQCRNAPCQRACTRGAITRREPKAALVVNADACDCCGACELACRLGMIRRRTPAGPAYKCDLCNGVPQCAAHCPQRAIVYMKAGSE